MARRCTQEVVLPSVVRMALIMPVGRMGLLYLQTIQLLSTLIAIGTPVIGAATSTAIGTGSVATGKSQAVAMSLWWQIKSRSHASRPKGARSCQSASFALVRSRTKAGASCYTLTVADDTMPCFPWLFISEKGTAPGSGAASRRHYAVASPRCSRPLAAY